MTTQLLTEQVRGKLVGRPKTMSQVADHNASTRRLRVLISAYACEPDRGSEPGCGWNYINQASKHCDVYALTRSNNEPAILAAEAQNGPSGIRWIYYDLPNWVLSIKKRFESINLYYLLWQWFSVRFLLRNLEDVSFDVCHHLTFGSYAKPTFLYRLQGTYFVWGPIGGVGSENLSLLRNTRWSARIRELARIAFQRTLFLNPFALQIRRNVDLVLGVSPRVLRWFSNNRSAVLSQVGVSSEELTDAANASNDKNARYTILMAGRLVHWKGFALGIEGFAAYLEKATREASLVIMGEGPEKKRLQALVKSLGLDSCVVFRGTRSRSDYLEELRSCDVFLFPSTHEPGAYTVAESLMSGVPVICTDFGEAATLIENGISGFGVPLESASSVISSISQCLKRLEDEDLRSKMSAAARERATALSWDNRGRALFRQYLRVCGYEESLREP